MLAKEAARGGRPVSIERFIPGHTRGPIPFPQTTDLNRRIICQNFSLEVRARSTMSSAPARQHGLFTILGSVLARGLPNTVRPARPPAGFRSHHLVSPLRPHSSQRQPGHRLELGANQPSTPLVLWPRNSEYYEVVLPLGPTHDLTPPCLVCLPY